MVEWIRSILRYFGFSENEISEAIGSGLIETIVIAGAIVLGVIGWLIRKPIAAFLRWLAMKTFGLKPKEENPQLQNETQTSHKLEIQVVPSPPQPLLEPTPPIIEHPSHSNIPPSSSVGFVSRKNDEGHDLLELLKNALDPKSNQLVTLHGAGGIGKTTLAAEAARALINSFKGRIIWISADRPNFTFVTLLDEIARWLKSDDLLKLITEEKREGVKRELSKEPTLIVLDNFETVAAAEQTLCVDFLYGDSPYPALITTRFPVNRARNIPVHRMHIEEAKEFLQRLIKDAQHSNRFTENVLQQIMDTGERNPLVMKWIVAQIDRAQTVKEVFDELAHGEGEAAERVFNRSFNLEQTGDDGRACLMALSLFTPSASREALAQVAGFGDDKKRFNKAIATLSALWLIETTDDAERLLIEGLTKGFADSQLSKQKIGKEICANYVAYFLQYAKSYSKPTPEHFNELEKEIENLLNATDVAFDQNLDSEGLVITGNIAHCVTGVLSVRGYWDEAIKYSELALKIGREFLNEDIVAFFTHSLAVSYRNRGESAKARQLYEECLEIRKRLGQENEVANILHDLGAALHDEGQIVEAKRLYDDSLKINERLGYQSGIASTLHNLAAIAQTEGDIAEAKKLYNESLKIEEKLGDQIGIAITLYQLGGLAYYEGEIIETKRLYNESLTIQKKLGNQIGIANTLAQLGLLAEEEGNKSEAIRLLHEALSIYERLNHPYREMAKKILARLESDENDDEKG